MLQRVGQVPSIAQHVNLGSKDHNIHNLSLVVRHYWQKNRKGKSEQIPNCTQDHLLDCSGHHRGIFAAEGHEKRYS